MMYFDAHFHLVPSVEQWGKEVLLDFYKGNNYAITCAHNPDEFVEQEFFIKKNELEENIIQAFGIHPQLPMMINSAFLENLLKNKKIKLIGETGFDFFTEDFKEKKKEQNEAFHLSLELAASYNVPIVIHNRKGLDEMLKNTKELSKVPLVLFHSFAFSSREALSILNHNVNAVFSFSKQILNGNKKSLSCVQELPLDKIFLETDAPFQTLKGESFTNPSEIQRIYSAAAEIKKMSLESFCNEIGDNFKRIFYSL